MNRQPVQCYTGRIVDGVDNRWRDRNHAWLRQALGTEWTGTLSVVDEDGRNGWCVGKRRNQIAAQARIVDPAVLAKQLFEQRVTNPHHSTPFNLTFGQRRIHYG